MHPNMFVTCQQSKQDIVRPTKQCAGLHIQMNKYQGLISKNIYQLHLQLSWFFKRHIYQLCKSPIHISKHFNP